MRRRPPALQGSGLAAQPRARRSGGEESRAARLGLSVYPARQKRRAGEPRAGRGGAEQGLPLGHRPFGFSPSRRLASSSQPELAGPRARRSAAGDCWLRGSGPANGDGWRGREAGLQDARTRPDLSAESLVEQRAPSGGRGSAPRDSHLRALLHRDPAGVRLASPRPRRLRQPPLESHGPSDTLQNLPGYS